ncbi:glycosyltransferase [Pimelobacter simplex]|uniref:glycosyltransferase n=1 Tax=Nocardioides simplex TaxID=2045 RepID=UPI003AAE1367
MTSTTRVLHVIESFGAGSLTSMLQYVRAMPELEHHLLFRPRPGEYEPAGELALFATTEVLPGGHRAARSAVRAAVRRVRPAVVHAHSTYAGGYVRLAVRSTPRCRIVYTPHCFAFERGDVPAPARRLYRLAERVLARNCDTLAACSPREALLGRGWGYRRVVVVPNVAARATVAVAGAAGPGPLCVVTIGRVSPQKDPAFFAGVVTRLRQTHPDATATWIGAGEPALVAVLERAGVRVTGWRSHPEAVAELAGAAVYVHTGAWEGFPMSVLEADAADRPIVVRRIPAFAGSSPRWSWGTPAAVAAAVADAAAHPAQNRASWRAFLRDHDLGTQRERLRRVYLDTEVAR